LYSAGFDFHWSKSSEPMMAPCVTACAAAASFQVSRTRVVTATRQPTPPAARHAPLASAPIFSWVRVLASPVPTRMSQPAAVGRVRVALKGKEMSLLPSTATAVGSFSRPSAFRPGALRSLSTPTMNAWGLLLPRWSWLAAAGTTFMPAGPDPAA
jgi:hypothetical protein